MNYFDTKEYKNAVAIIKKQYAHLWDLFNTYCEKVAIYNDVKTDFFDHLSKVKDYAVYMDKLSHDSTNYYATVVERFQEDVWKPRYESVLAKWEEQGVEPMTITSEDGKFTTIIPRLLYYGGVPIANNKQSLKRTLKWARFYRKNAAPTISDEWEKDPRSAYAHGYNDIPLRYLMLQEEDYFQLPDWSAPLDPNWDGVTIYPGYVLDPEDVESTKDFLRMWHQNGDVYIKNLEMGIKETEECIEIYTFLAKWKPTIFNEFVNYMKTNGYICKPLERLMPEELQ